LIEVRRIGERERRETKNADASVGVAGMPLHDSAQAPAAAVKRSPPRPAGKRAIRPRAFVGAADNLPTMPVIAIVNPKGGSGKSTLATHLAGHAARRGLPVMLGDVDRQKSTVLWLRRRALEPLAREAPIVSWVADPRNLLRPPSGVSHVVLDTPGGLRGFELARVVMTADALLMPVCDSAFDRDAAKQAWAELQTHPRVSSGRCRVAIVGMRIDARTRAEATLRAWADAIDAPFIGVLRDTQGYVRCIERGLTIFDLPTPRAQADREQWAPIIDWLEPLWTRQDLVGTPSQAGALDDIAPEPMAEPAPRAVRVTRPSPLRPVDGALADALAPAGGTAAPSMLQRWLGWPWGRREAAPLGARRAAALR
jgi:chromosome partitioning protein